MNQVVKVQRKMLVACMTCPLCNNIFVDATTISECLHTFCRNCIYDKITEDELECCPVCNTNLGCTPLEKLKADHTMEEIREKILPCKRMKMEAAESLPSDSSPPAKIKERSLSSLVNTTAPSISQLQNGITTSQQCLSLTATATTPTKFKFIQNNSKVIEREIKVEEGENVTPSNYGCHVQDTIAGVKQIQIEYKPKFERVENGCTSASYCSVEPEKLQDVSGGERLATNNELNLHPKGTINMNCQCNTVSNPIWFSLVASDYQYGDKPLPQISSKYLRVRDGSLPVSIIQKYLMMKLGLATEIEVEISLMGKPLSSTLHLHHAVDLWRQTTTKIGKIQISSGSTAKDFVMVLTYGRRAEQHKC